MDKDTKTALTVVGAIVAIGLFFLVNPLVQIDEGEAAIVLRLGEYNRTIDPGLHGRIPFIESVKKYDVRQQAISVPADAASKDLQSLSTTVTVNYFVEGSTIGNLYTDIGLAADYQLKVIDPSVQEAVKAATAFYTAEESITKREAVKGDITRLLKEGVIAKAGPLIVVKDVSITDFQFSPEFDAAIEAKVKAQQDALKAQNDLARIEFEAQQKIATAEAEARATRLISDAANNQRYIELKALEVQLEFSKRWNGVYPTTYVVSSGDGSGPVQVIPLPTANR